MLGLRIEYYCKPPCNLVICAVYKNFIHVGSKTVVLFSFAMRKKFTKDKQTNYKDIKRKKKYGWRNTTAKTNYSDPAGLKRKLKKSTSRQGKENNYEI